LAARPRPRPSTLSEQESELTRHDTPPHAPYACLGGRGTALSPPEVARKRPKEVERRTRARAHRDRSPAPQTQTREQRDRCPQSLVRVPGDRLSVPSDCSGRKACLGGPTCAWRERVSRHALALSRHKKGARAGPAQGKWSRSSNALPGKVGCIRAGTPDPTMPVNWTAHDARTDDREMAARIAVHPRHAIGRHTCV